MSATGTILLAAEFATRAHRGQQRKYTGEPYMVHPISVARMVYEVGGSPHAICAALLHDVVEDCPWVKPSEIDRVFGSAVCGLVMQVTKVSRDNEGTRAERVAQDTAHYAGATAEGQTIKLADTIDNTRTVLLHDNGFAAIYMAEKRELLGRMIRGDRGLYAQARRQIDEFFDSRRQHGSAA